MSIGAVGEQNHLAELATAEARTSLFDSEKLHTNPVATQQRWASQHISGRLAVLRRARHLLATRQDLVCAAISTDLHRTDADTLVAELLPLLAACRYLERRAAGLLRPRHLGTRGRPFWLAGVHSVIERIPLGRILVIGPGNYPLLLPGVQSLQALAAGNSVTWKPGRGGAAVAHVVADALRDAGLPEGLLSVTEESVTAAEQAVAQGIDKVIFTGSATSARLLLHQLAETLTPSVTELSGCDAMIVLPDADLTAVVDALCFGMRLNGSATCMAPRRLVLVGLGESAAAQLSARLREAFASIAGVQLTSANRATLEAMLADARRQGGSVVGDPSQKLVRPILVFDGSPVMQIAKADIFVPVLTVLSVRDAEEAAIVHESCPYALTVSIFGGADKARHLSKRLTAGTVTINDLIVATADPRVPFGGRKASGFGTTRGAEGLLEMTAAKVTAARSKPSVRQYQATGDAHRRMFGGLIRWTHAGSWSARWSGLRQMVAGASELNWKAGDIREE